MRIILGLMLLSLTGCSALFPNGLFPTYYSIAYDVALKDCERMKAQYAGSTDPNDHLWRVLYGKNVDCDKQAKINARYLAATTVAPSPSVYISTPTSAGTITSAW